MFSLNHVRRFCTSLAQRSKLYELRVYSFRPGNLKKFVEYAEDALPIRFEHSPALGYFFSEVGGLGEAVHIWEYDSYSQRADCRMVLAADESWGAKAAPMIDQLDKQDNMSMRLFSWSELNTDVTPGGAYFLYSFTFLPDVTSVVISDSLEKFIKENNLTSLGAWSGELGDNACKKAYAMFHSPELDEKKNPSLLSPFAWSKLSKLTSSIHGRLLTPANWSDPWK